MKTRIALKISAAGLTDVGRRRKHNEDALLLAPDLALFGVCDGVGGHSKGDVASQLAVATMEGFFRSERPIADWIASAEDMPPGAQRLFAAVWEANAAVFREGHSHADEKSMGSTVVALHVADGALYIVHVGDSRCYRFNGGRLEQITRDHNMRNDALRLNPKIPEWKLAKLPTNAVTRALGHREEVEPDICALEPLPGEVYLLCSDGLCGLVPDEEIRGALEFLGDDLEIACSELVRMANDAGGKDNISVVLVRFEAEEEGAYQPPEIDVEAPPCVWCGARWARGMSFCVRCGRPPPEELEEEELEVQFCTECGAELLVDTSFCVECGAPHRAYD